MELTNIIHTHSQDLPEFKPDIFIAASGYESRATCVAEIFKDLDCDKIALGFDERRKELHRPENDKYFESQGFRQIIQQTHLPPDYKDIFKHYTSRELHVLFDISVMTRDWYYGLLSYISENQDYDHFHLRILYCPAYYNEPVKLRNSISMRSFSLSDNMRFKNSGKKKTALILGLGIEKNISEKIHDLIKADSTFLFYADPAIEQQYVENLFANNHGLINRTPIRNLKGYPLDDTKKIYHYLVDTILPLREEYNIIIVPQGPKIFSVISMVFQMSYPDIELSYPSYKVKRIRDRKPYNRFTSIDLEFECD